MDYIERNRIEREYIKNAQVGDIFYCSGRSTRLHEVKVVRVTKTQLVLENGAKINRDTGREVGAHTWNSISYTPGCPHIKEEMDEINQKLKVRDSLKATEGVLKSRIQSLIASDDVEAMSKMTEALEALLK